MSINLLSHKIASNLNTDLRKVSKAKQVHDMKILDLAHTIDLNPNISWVKLVVPYDLSGALLFKCLSQVT